MASLKEVKGRIASVNNTRKITSAMKMVASAKLHKAQAAIESMLPYERRLHHILTDFMSNCTEVTSPFIVKREVKKVAVVVFASNTSLCGGFNANVIRHLVDLLAEYKPLGLENILVFPVGKKVADAVRKLGFRIEGDFQHMADKPSYQEAADLAADLMKRFEKTYDIRIVIQNKSLHDYKCSGKCRVSDGVDFILQVLQRSTRFTFSRSDDNTISKCVTLN